MRNRVRVFFKLGCMICLSVFLTGCKTTETENSGTKVVSESERPDQSGSIMSKYEDKYTYSFHLDTEEKVSYAAEDGTQIIGYHAVLAIECKERIDADDVYTLSGEILANRMESGKSDVSNVSLTIDNAGEHKEYIIEFASKERNKIVISGNEDSERTYRNIDLGELEYLVTSCEADFTQYKASDGGELKGSFANYELTLLKELDESDISDILMACVEENESVGAEMEDWNVIEYDFEVMLYGKSMGKRVIRYKDVSKSEWIEE